MQPRRLDKNVTCRSKRKLLVVVGAGASIEFGMPSVDGVGDILSDAAQQQYPLFTDAASNLYKYFERTLIAGLATEGPATTAQKEGNF
jgi:hypothetical protein